MSNHRDVENSEKEATKDSQNSNSNMVDYVSGDSARSSSSHIFHKKTADKSNGRNAKDNTQDTDDR